MTTQDAQIGLRLPARIVTEIDRRAAALGVTRSWLIRNWLEPFAEGVVRSEADRDLEYQRRPWIVQPDASASKPPGGK
jgi:hypothetical protein